MVLDFQIYLAAQGRDPLSFLIGTASSLASGLRERAEFFIGFIVASSAATAKKHSLKLRPPPARSLSRRPSRSLQLLTCRVDDVDAAGKSGEGEGAL